MIEDKYIIPKHLQEQFDIPKLSKFMEKADWYCEYSEDPRVWRDGKEEVNRIKDQLLQISIKDEGLELANWLWDAFVPEHSFSKPDFLIEKNKTGQTNALPASSEMKTGPPEQRRDQAKQTESQNDLSENKNARHIKNEKLLPKKRTSNKKGLSM